MVVGANLESCKYLIQVEECRRTAPDPQGPGGPVDGDPVEHTRTGPSVAQSQMAVVRSAFSANANVTSAKPVARVGLKRRHTVSINSRILTTCSNHNKVNFIFSLAKDFKLITHSFHANRIILCVCVFLTFDAKHKNCIGLLKTSIQHGLTCNCGG